MLGHGLPREGGDVQLDGRDDGPVLMYHLARPGVLALRGDELGPGALVHRQVWQQLTVAAYQVFVAAGLLLLHSSFPSK